MSTLTPEERVERVRAALAEAGYDRSDVHDYVWVRDDGHFTFATWRFAPEDVWRATAVIGDIGVCWPCYRDADRKRPIPPCDHDPLTEPWPEVSRG